MRAVHAVVPKGIDDPSRPSGGNAYDRHVCRELAAAGWAVREHQVAGGWPQPDEVALARLRAVLAGLDDGAVVLIDGLVASSAPTVLAAEGRRLRLVVLVHMAMGDPTADDATADAGAHEAAALAAATAVVTTSDWTRRRLLELYPLAPDALHVALPGVAPADLAEGTAAGGRLLAVAAVIPRKGQDVLVEALAHLDDLAWQCDLVGTVERDAPYADGLRRRARAHGIAGRVHLRGPRTGAALDATYAASDLLVLPSRGEPYGMVVTEALARGLPVVASDVGGLPEALGTAADGSRPGILVPPGDPAALADALRAWLTDADLRERLRRAARGRRAGLAGWDATGAALAAVLARAAR